MERRRAQAFTAKPAIVAAGPGAAAADQKDFPQRQRETAEYLAEMILELRNLARSVKLHTIMVPLEYAYYEAFGVANKVEVPPAEAERIRELSRAAEELDLDPANGGI